MTFQNTDARYCIFNNAERDQYNITQVNSLDQTLQRLQPAQMDASTRSECLYGTRTVLIQSIVDWSATFSEQQVLWLYGLAGSGKSTISTTIANLVREKGRLGAFIFFNRDVEERSRPSNVIRTLAYRLASADPRIGALVATVVENIPSISESPLSFQFTKLLIEPLSNLPTTEAPIVLILDALDECGSAEDRSSLLALLAAESSRLPSFIRILITSRAEFDIRRAFEVQPHVLVHELALASDDNMKDILSFLRSRMAEIRLKNSSLPLVHDWPDDAAILALNRRAAGLFVWASTACRFVDGHDPRRNLELILRGDVSTTAESALDVLYRTALEAAVADRWHDEYFRADFCSIMGTILVARNPISDKTIDALLSLERPSHHTISRLGCVLHWNDAELVRILHPSFAEFLSSPLRCGTWYIDALLHNRHLAVHCLRHLGLILRRNIFNLTLTSYPVHETLPEATSYACISWIDHICMITEHAEMIGDMLEQFILQHLVHWLEAMSVLKKSRTTITSINRLLEWVHIRLPCRTKLQELLRDASRFVQTFATSIEEHPLQVYLTALPFSPIDTLLYKTFVDYNCPYIVGGFNKSWPPLLHMLQGHQDMVESVVFFPDSTRIMSSSYDNTVRVCDATSGAIVLGPLIGNIVTVSCNGQRILSGSQDSSIRIWDAITGIEALPPLQGHTARIFSVAFSPDGTRIASGSKDQTVRVWDATSGFKVSETLQGHEDEVRSVTFTPDGRRIVSGSWDKTIRIWDATLGIEILPPLHGHELGIFSVAVSPDGNIIASGSRDGTIRIWDATTGSQKLVLPAECKRHSVVFFPDGERIAATIGYSSNKIGVWDAISGAQVYVSAVHKPMSCLAISPNGEQFAIGYDDGTVGLWDTTRPDEYIPNMATHSGSIVVMAFSPDGRYIASCSYQEFSIRLWDAQSGAQAMAPFQGHKEHIWSLVFSRDGKLIASCSSDTTIRVWDTVSGSETLSPLRGHERPISCVAFSPDGTRLVSGSARGNVRLWDAKPDALIIPPLRGHKELIRSVAFSPDGTRVISGCGEGLIRMWDIASRTETLRFSARCDSYPTSLAFSPDGRYIFVKCWQIMRAWDTCKACLTVIPSYIHASCTFSDPIIITPDAWIVDVATQRIIGKLPSMASVHRYAASKTSIAFTTGERDSTIFIMHFPSTVLTSPMTWNQDSYETEPFEEEEDEENTDSDDGFSDEEDKDMN